MAARRNSIFSKYYVNSKRLLFKSTRRPTSREYVITSRITAIGILVIGAIGFIVNLLATTIIATL